MPFTTRYAVQMLVARSIIATVQIIVLYTSIGSFGVSVCVACPVVGSVSCFGGSGVITAGPCG